MAVRLTDRQKQKIVADYLESGSYRATGKLNGVSDTTVRRVVESRDGLGQREEQDGILSYMESKREVVCDILDKGLRVLNDEEKLREASLPQITTAMKTLIDKWTEPFERRGQTAVEDLTPLADKLKG